MSTTPAETPADPPAEETPPKSEAKNVQATEYVVLTQAAPGGPWTEQANVVARSHETAIRSFLDGATEVEGTYVAVPARSWKPVTVKTETQTKLTLS